jgi:hypothetical protein
MTALMQRMYTSCNNFNEKGWLVLGFCGSQPTVADYYTSTGSLYLAALGFLPLGLPGSDPFWTAPRLTGLLKKHGTVSLSRRTTKWTIKPKKTAEFYQIK